MADEDQPSNDSDDTEEPGPVRPTTGFIGSFLDGPEQGLIVLRGDLDAAVVDRLGCHIDDFLAGPTRFLMIEARGVDSYHPELLDLLGHTQHRLGARCGMLQVRGLRPAQETEPAPAGPGAATPGPATDAAACAAGTGTK